MVRVVRTDNKESHNVAFIIDSNKFYEKVGKAFKLQPETFVLLDGARVLPTNSKLLSSVKDSIIALTPLDTFLSGTIFNRDGPCAAQAQAFSQCMLRGGNMFACSDEQKEYISCRAALPPHWVDAAILPKPSFLTGLVQRFRGDSVTATSTRKVAARRSAEAAEQEAERRAVAEREAEQEAERRAVAEQEREAERRAVAKREAEQRAVAKREAEQRAEEERRGKEINEEWETLVIKAESTGNGARLTHINEVFPECMLRSMSNRSFLDVYSRGVYEEVMHVLSELDFKDFILKTYASFNDHSINRDVKVNESFYNMHMRDCELEQIPTKEIENLHRSLKYQYVLGEDPDKTRKKLLKETDFKKTLKDLLDDEAIRHAACDCLRIAERIVLKQSDRGEQFSFLKKSRSFRLYLASCIYGEVGYTGKREQDFTNFFNEYFKLFTIKGERSGVFGEIHPFS